MSSATMPAPEPAHRAPPTVAEPAQAAASSKRLADGVFRIPQPALLGLLVVLLAATEIANHRFLSTQGIKDLLLNATILAIVGIGEAIVVITRNVDLSVGSVLGIAAFAAGIYLQGNGNSF